MLLLQVFSILSLTCAAKAKHSENQAIPKLRSRRILAPTPRVGFYLS